MQTAGPEYLEKTPLVVGLMRLLEHRELHSPGALAAWITQCLDDGLEVFDHADIYGDGECERLFGQALRAAPHLKHKVKLISKAGIVLKHQDTSPWRSKHYRAEAGYISAAIDASLQRLQVDQLHTFLIHRPDPLLEAPALARELEQAVESGKVRHIGVSNFLPEQWRWLQQNTHLPLVCNQSELSLGHPQPLFDGGLEAMLSDGLRWLAWSPLAGGKLPERIPGQLLTDAQRETGLCETGLAIAWIRQLPGAPIPVIGSLRSDRLQAASRGAQADLPRGLWYALLEAVQGNPVP
ncbi:putative oxidoreductase [Marinobacter sp. MBR-99]|jgi:predicted oxidoreductase|uniref:aldo/keto reductase n=1 Tax=Marinobacter sp. MBR-99 TaxID=3156461 RepID=UPI003396EDED